MPAPVISHNWPSGVKSVEPTLKQLVELRILTYESLEEPSRVAEQNLMRSAWRSGPRVMKTHSRNIADGKRCHALLMSAGRVHELAHAIRLAAETNNRCPNAHAFTSFIHKMGFCFYILCTADTKTNIF